MNLIGTALAASQNPVQKSWLEQLSINPFSPAKDLLDVIAAGINAFLLLAGSIAVIYLIYGGVLYITAGGDAEKATKGRTALINAIIGIIIILAAFAIANFVATSLK